MKKKQHFQALESENKTERDAGSRNSKTKRHRERWMNTQRGKNIR